MKLSIKGFKSVKALNSFAFLPLTMLTGINSSGKTSLTQGLLLLKQTLESESKEALRLDGKYIATDSEHDLVYGKGATDQFEFTIELEDKELKLISGYKENGVTYLKYTVDFHVNSGVYVHAVDMDVVHGGRSASVSLRAEDDVRSSRKYKIALQHLKMNRGWASVDFNRPFAVSFSNFFPQYATGYDTAGEQVTLPVPLMEEVMALVTGYFSHVSYVGPLRVKPEPIISYSSSSFKDVGVDGLYTRFMLHNRRDTPVNGKETLLEATRRWICGELKLAESLTTIKDGTNSYRVVLRNKGVDVDLCHVGLGVSQVLPIIVQGLLVPAGGMLIVDSPEAHMHPSVQAGLVDFFIELSREGHRVLAETHSDHMVTRLRRRIAEGLDPADVNLCFVTNTESGSTYETLGIDDCGTFFGGLPEGFMDTQDQDLRKALSPS